MEITHIPQRIFNLKEQMFPHYRNNLFDETQHGRTTSMVENGQSTSQVGTLHLDWKSSLEIASVKRLGGGVRQELASVMWILMRRDRLANGGRWRKGKKWHTLGGDWLRLQMMASDCKGIWSLQPVKGGAVGRLEQWGWVCGWWTDEVSVGGNETVMGAGRGIWREVWVRGTG